MNTRFSRGYNITSGSNPTTTIRIDPNFENSGGSTGITRTLHIVPNLTTVADFRGIDLEFNDANAKGIYQAGSNTINNFQGSTAFGTTSAPNASAIVDVVSTTKGFGLPSMTSTERDAISSPRDGLVVYNSTDDFISLRANGVWVDIDPAGDGNGIYGGSGTIAESTTSTLTGLSYWHVDYDNAVGAIEIDDSSGDIRFNSADETSQLIVSSTQVYASADGQVQFNSNGYTVEVGSNGFVILGGTNPAKIHMTEPSGSGTNYTEIITQAQGANITYTLPATAAVGLLHNDGSNIWSWSTVSNSDLDSGVGGIYKGSGNIASAAVATIADESTFTIDYFDGSNALHFVDNGETFSLTSGAAYGINANSSQVQMIGPNSDYVSVTSTGPIARGGLSITNGYLSLPSDISPAQITADQNDYSPTGLDDASVLRLTSDASRTITGIDASVKRGDGDLLTIINVGSNNIILSDDDASSSATNRMFLGGTDITLFPEFSVTLIYDDTSNV